MAGFPATRMGREVRDHRRNEVRVPRAAAGCRDCRNNSRGTGRSADPDQSLGPQGTRGTANRALAQLRRQAAPRQGGLGIRDNSRRADQSGGERLPRRRDAWNTGHSLGGSVGLSFMR